MCRLYSSSLFLYALYINMIDTSFGQFAHTKLTRSIQQLDNESKLSMSEQLPWGTRISLAGFAFGYFKPQGNVLRNTLRSLELRSITGKNWPSMSYTEPSSENKTCIRCSMKNMYVVPCTVRACLVQCTYVFHRSAHITGNFFPSTRSTTRIFHH